jgi:phospholipase/carboxylesterase
MAAALLLTGARLLAAAILVRPLSPFRHDPATRLEGVRALIIAGEKETGVRRAVIGVPIVERP